MQIIYFKHLGSIPRLQKDLNYDSINKFQVSFRQHEYDPETKSFWVGTKIDFSGNNAAQFYNIIKQQKFDWDIFDLQRTSLSRFDLYYFRANKPDDKISPRDFMHECKRTLEYSRRNVESVKTSTGVTLYIRNRKTDHSSRLYIKKGEEDCLKFEYEMKKNFLRKYHILLTSYQLEELEHDLTLSFFRYFGKLELPLNHSQVDWLLVKMRPLRKQKSFFQG